MAPGQIVLEHGRLRCVLARRGAELRSLLDTTSGEEYIWQRDDAVWGDSAPILFPVVGRLKNGSYSHNGRRYTLPIHGFARSSDFILQCQARDSAALVLREDAGTLAHYPFAFALHVIFTLAEDSLTVAYEVRNPGADVLLFSLGSHPGLRLPPSAHGCADWRIEFSEQEADRCFRLDGELLATQSSAAGLRNGRSLPLSATLFSDDALIFKQLRSRQLLLTHRDGTPRLAFDTGGAPDLGLWSRPGAPYLCIEPWHGYDDDHAVSGELAAKPGIVRLPPGQVFRTQYTIRLFP